MCLNKEQTIISIRFHSVLKYWLDVMHNNYAVPYIKKKNIKILSASVLSGEVKYKSLKLFLLVNTVVALPQRAVSYDKLHNSPSSHVPAVTRPLMITA